ncbi:MAG: hypothetical protein DME55_07640 [Verrucomicrobia bacterium]|nr:MAG: hypothetical protein DME55_07640 [Verrucomicrobiota bacterium]
MMPPKHKAPQPLRRLPPKAERLPPSDLGALLEQALTAMIVNPEYPGVPLDKETREKIFATMPLEEQKRLLVKAGKEVEKIYTRATGYQRQEHVPWNHATQLLTGTVRPSTADTRLHSYFPLTIEERSVSRPPCLTSRLSFISPGEPKVLRRKETFSYSAFRDQYKTVGFTQAELMKWATVFSQVSTDRRTQARRCNLTKAKHHQKKFKVSLAPPEMTSLTP